MRVFAPTLLLASVVSCQASPPEGVFGCDSAADCPTGWVCGEDGLCWESAASGGDGATTDGGDPTTPGDDRLPGEPLPGDVAPSCHDGVHNGDETDVDCGAVCPNLCAAGRGCETRADCATDLCSNNTCEVPPEDCFNGEDDDDDELIDCADGDCLLFGLCVQSVTTPFTGYYRIRTDVFGTTADYPCRGGGSAERYFTSAHDTATCQACTCGNWSGGTCGTAQLYCDPNGGGCDSNNLVVFDQFCVYRPFAGETDMECFVENGPVTNAGSCTPSGGAYSPSDMWDEVVDVCGGEAFGAGCGVGACAPLPESEYESICVIADGDLACPSGFPTRHLVYGDATDGRGCSACVCNASATCSGATFHINDGVSCSSNDPNIDSFGNTTCTDVGWVNDPGGYGTWSVRHNASDTASGSCTHSGGDPIGAIEPKDPRTICCL